VAEGVVIAALEIAFWAAAALVAYAYVGYPVALLVLSRRRRPAAEAAPPAVPPRVSFVITARNEEARIRQKVENTLAQDYPADALEILVASDCSDDATDAIVGEFAPRVRLVRAAQRKGKEAAQQLAVAAAAGDVIVFSDVATALSPDGISRIVAPFADPTVGCVSSVDRFVDADGRVSGEGAYVRYEMRLRALEERVAGVVGLSGSFFAARREVCRRWSADRQSDFNTALNAVRLGLRGAIAPRAIGYYRDLADGRREFERKVRTVVRGLHVLFASLDVLNPFRHGLFAWQLASHKLGRGLVPPALGVAAAANLVLAARAPLYAATLALQVAFYATAVAGIVSGASPLRIPAYFVRANLAVFVAWMRFARGERIALWNPSERVAALPAAEARP
jgi:glycosyltransferase involved in cell wall biosynthesis